MTPDDKAQLRVSLGPSARVSTEDRLLRYLLSDSS